MVVEFTGMTFVAVLRRDGVTGKQPGKQSLPRFRTSPVFHDRIVLVSCGIVPTTGALE